MRSDGANDFDSCHREMHHISRHAASHMDLAMDSLEGQNAIIHVYVRFTRSENIIAHDNVCIVACDEELDEYRNVFDCIHDSEIDGDGKTLGDNSVPKTFQFEAATRLSSDMRKMFEGEIVIDDLDRGSRIDTNRIIETTRMLKFSES